MTVISGDAIPKDPESHYWDVVVIGTGAGGATAGFNLARLGRSVLFLERGKVLHCDPSIIKGTPFSWNGEAEGALRHGWWPRSIYRKDGDVEVASRPLAGCGTGGSTALFGMVMDRLRPQDFTPRRFFPEAPDTSLPEAWPITYEELEPFYERAEELFRVRGTPDPLAPTSGGLLDAPPASDKELLILDALTRVGLHPFRIHSASEHVPNCSGCPGMLCPHECRNDSGRICLRPALEQYEAKILPECRVVRLEEKNRKVQQAICDWKGRRIAVRGQVFVLAANAFFSPAILQRSANERFPDGLANSSGLVGRNLMLHVSDFFLLRLRGAPLGLSALMNHGLSLNDFYVNRGTKLGNVHAHATRMSPAGVEAFLRLHVKRLNSLPAPIMSALASLGAYMHRSAIVSATIVEDLPYPVNRVTAKAGSDDDVVYEYRYPDELRRRSGALLQSLKAAVGSRFALRRLGSRGDLNIGHACGTCRFGNDPRASVLDRDNRAHDLDNLYVVDASFFPSSGGVGPSLTIVANSLRVSEKIAKRL
ncbi:MAG: FAD-dependent oxidoreductase [Candidatus Binataceae bacterium]